MLSALLTRVFNLIRYYVNTNNGSKNQEPKIRLCFPYYCQGLYPPLEAGTAWYEEHRCSQQLALMYCYFCYVLDLTAAFLRTSLSIKDCLNYTIAESVLTVQFQGLLRRNRYRTRHAMMLLWNRNNK